MVRAGDRPVNEKSPITCAMILAAGLGTRMRPITHHIPKPLIKINNQALIDYKIAAARRAGIDTIIVNIHHLADQVIEHLSHITDLKIIISDESDQLMESGGGILKALPHFGEEAFVVMNSDAFWAGERSSNLRELTNCWNRDEMDILLSLAELGQAVGFEGAGDFFMDDRGHLLRRGKKKSAPYAFAGDYIVHPRIFKNLPRGPFSSNILFDRAIDEGKLLGKQLQGTWLHVGTPDSIKVAQHAIALLHP